ncbi:arrestin domain-containing protein 3-like [Synchiropus splendidus]|uniref:arrestin domain-containing protein 3-like n=1 Tax=Synchiropus splendidus TaxID=270530 RepID=UPI00237D6D4B|nr:arrestin domain-containing protein 3-like [Synchiropus splendidus]
MTSSIKTFTVGYNPINKSNVFRSGDTVTGQILVETSKECTVSSLWVKLKGKATVKWTETYGRTVVTYYDKEKYFSIKTEVIHEGRGNNILRAGNNVFPFTFQIPAQDLPPSFKGSCGKIKYTLKANLSRSMRTDSKAKAVLTVVHQASLNSDPILMSPQHESTSKKMKLFSSGNVSLDVKLERTGYIQGQGIMVVATIENKTSRDIRPKYCLYKKYSYFAKGNRRVETKDIVKEVGETISPLSYQTVSKVITIPPDTCVSIQNCKILKAEYRLRVYLDVKYASDPEIKFPISILPVVPTSDEMAAPPPAYGFDAFSQTNFGGNVLPPAPMYDSPYALPPAYTPYSTYPSLADFNEKS